MSALRRSATAIGILLVLASIPLRPAVGADQLTIIRDNQYVCVMGKKDDILRFTLSCRRHSDRPTGVSFTVIEPDSDVLREGLVPVGQANTFSRVLRKDGMHVIAFECVGNTYDIAVADLPSAYLASKEHKFHLCGQCKPLYFFAPKGTKRLSLFVCAGTRGEGALITIRNPEGEIAHQEDGDYDKETELKVDVPAGQDGSAWSITFEKPGKKEIQLDDVVLHLGPEIKPFVSERKDWAALFGRE